MFWVTIAPFKGLVYPFPRSSLYLPKSSINLSSNCVPLSLTFYSISNNHSSPSADVKLINTIVAKNPLGGNCDSRIIPLGHNLDDDTCNLTEPTDLPNTDPMLGPLKNNGGPTETHALLPGSPAIDAGDDRVTPPTDQRGEPRPQGAASDIGAYETANCILN